MREISLHVLDIVENSISAGASLICITLDIDHKKDSITIEIEDNGKGMDGEMLKKVTSPFTTTRTTRNVGLGIPLFMQSALQTGGSFDIDSKLGEGTKLCASYVLSSIDRAPIGDFAGTVHMLIVCNPKIDFAVTIITDGNTETLLTAEVRKVLGEDIPLDSPEVSAWLKGSLNEIFDEKYALL